MADFSDVQSGASSSAPARNKTVTVKSGDSLSRIAKRKATVWVQDYQLIHVAQFVREKAEQRRVGFFLHIPFPPYDIFLKLPWRGQILAAREPR